ncbi:MAG: hypothetical protein A3C81_02220 [Candidatus Yanofskybacteria bacterium RIFCSPHIGHO2_02_FULL_46_19]|uniref:Phosphatidic acid phosphatase type 2/haloperoxidase domain-containing protein n=1 Tax=Candidatus Yanofskybacteria bacterium RIFCSPHIGHO2_02_FULL_46_19 TaxID=1802684 RepID=A0A1F8FUK0_9BACT|nr:MAG: hypothetical protein A3C81_02220 [Candidatus Yanofskybacteria bacterium RIFCSPHIGHO2_02_FULL_46_19]OGN25928.1 MAG: hypothetical protein A3B17_01265 [Candidatus Yanofskybacteria bacterium RIFCSPLOWO2_01_FULL_45_72]
MNLYLFQLINSFAGRYSWLDKLGIFFADWFAYLVILSLLVIAWRHRWPKQLLVIPFGSAVAARVVVEIIRFFYHHPRPFVVLADTHKLLDESSYSFPSGHASFFFALATGIYFYNKKLGACYLLLATVISIARVFAGIHWPLDILAGAGLGIATAYLTARFSKTANQ